jgi:hypothetical protein
MNKELFLKCQHVRGFVDWALATLPHIQIDLDVSKAGSGRALNKLGPGVKGRFRGIDAVVNAYQWRSAYLYKNEVGSTCLSTDWDSTHKSLKKLGSWLRQEVMSKNREGVLLATQSIVIWGGDLAHKKASPKGAMPFLNSLDNLPQYLIDTQRALRLDTANLNSLSSIGRMNAMLTKVHALLSEDGLPIYDSRVAGAIGALVEMYRSSMIRPFEVIPETLVFKATDRKDRRRVCFLANAQNGMFRDVLDPGVINRANIDGCTREWSSSKIRLGWLLSAIIEQADRSDIDLLASSNFAGFDATARMHAFEAALFMIGFSLDCLAPRK